MRSWSVAFLTIAVLAALLGFGGGAGREAQWAKGLSLAFLVLAAAVLWAARKRRKSLRRSKASVSSLG